MEENGLRSSRTWSGALAFALWAGTAAAGLAAIATVLGVAIRVYAAFWGDYSFYGSDYRGALALRNFMVFPLAFLWLAMAVGGGEYHYKNLGQPKSWRLFAHIIAVEVSIFVLALFV